MLILHSIIFALFNELFIIIEVYFTTYNKIYTI